jgi:hypothetical protein
VKPAEDGWYLARDGRALPVWRSKHRPEVLQYARRVARMNRPCRLVIHLEDGSVESEEFYEAPDGDSHTNGRRW